MRKILEWEISDFQISSCKCTFSKIFYSSSLFLQNHPAIWRSTFFWQKKHKQKRRKYLFPAFPLVFWRLTVRCHEALMKMHEADQQPASQLPGRALCYIFIDFWAMTNLIIKSNQKVPTTQALPSCCRSGSRACFPKSLHVPKLCNFADGVSQSNKVIKH